MSPAPNKALIAEVAALQRKKSREETGRILVETRHPIEEAVRAGLTLHEWFVLQGAPQESLPKEALSKPAFEVDEKAMARMASTSSPPPCLAVFEAPRPSLEIKGDLVLVLDALQDPGNIGTLLRSAMAFGFETVVLVGDCVEPYNPKVIRASTGLVLALNILELSSADELAGLFPASQWKLYVTSGQARAQSYETCEYAGPCAIVLGNEGQGVSQAITALPGVRLMTIPMMPRVESLNVAVSGSVIMAEAAAFRRRNA